MGAKRHRLDLDEADHRLLVAAAARFGLSQSEGTSDDAPKEAHQ